MLKSVPYDDISVNNQKKETIDWYNAVIQWRDLGYQKIVIDRKGFWKIQKSKNIKILPIFSHSLTTS
jgi:hypothetical protein